MNFCPVCKKPAFIQIWPTASQMQTCPSCAGSFIPFHILPSYVQSKHAIKIAQSAATQSKISQRDCPSCSEKMSLIQERSRLGFYELDVCSRCKAVWFDREQLEAAPRTPNFMAVEKELAEDYFYSSNQRRRQLIVKDLLTGKKGFIPSLLQWLYEFFCRGD